MWAPVPVQQALLAETSNSFQIFISFSIVFACVHTYGLISEVGVLAVVRHLTQVLINYLESLARKYAFLNAEPSKGQAFY